MTVATTEAYVEPARLTPAAFAGIVKVVLEGVLTREQLEQIPDPQAAAQSISHIPPDPANADWQTYQAWLDAGNTPLAEPLDKVKARKIDLYRSQLSSYINTGMISQTIFWRTTEWGFNQHALVGSMDAGDYLTGDGKAHMIDAGDIERVLTPTQAKHTRSAAQHWLLIAYREYQAEVDKVNACTTNDEVEALSWVPQYTPQAPFNADALVVGTS